MRSTFTPGPWSVGKKTGTLVFTGSDGGMGDFICEVSGEDDTPREVNKANARLIAAAPELYEECRALYAVMFHMQCPKCRIAWSEDECQEMGARRKAICLCGYEQAIDGTALSKAAGEGV